MKNLKELCKSLTGGLFGTFTNTILFLLKKYNKVKILSVYHHIEYSNFWDELRVEINDIVIGFRVSYPSRFQTVITFNYIKTPDGLITKVDEQYKNTGFCIYNFYNFFIELAHAKENDVYTVSNIENANYLSESEGIEYQYNRGIDMHNLIFS